MFGLGSSKAENEEEDGNDDDGEDEEKEGQFHEFMEILLRRGRIGNFYYFHSLKAFINFFFSSFGSTVSHRLYSQTVDGHGDDALAM